jgi:hypothetical protein
MGRRMGIGLIVDGAHLREGMAMAYLGACTTMNAAKWSYFPGFLCPRCQGEAAKWPHFFHWQNQSFDCVARLVFRVHFFTFRACPNHTKGSLHLFLGT